MGKKVFPLIVNRTFDVHDQDDISILKVLLNKFLRIENYVIYIFLKTFFSVILFLFVKL